MSFQWKHSRDENGDVVWLHGSYAVLITAETASAKPCGWGVKIDGAWAMTKPSPRAAKLFKSYRKPHQMNFRKVADAKLWCWRHYIAALKESK